MITRRWRQQADNKARTAGAKFLCCSPSRTSCADRRPFSLRTANYRLSRSSIAACSEEARAEGFRLAVPDGAHAAEQATVVVVRHSGAVPPEACVVDLPVPVIESIDADSGTLHAVVVLPSLEGLGL